MHGTCTGNTKQPAGGNHFLSSYFMESTRRLVVVLFQSLGGFIIKQADSPWSSDPVAHLWLGIKAD